MLALPPLKVSAPLPESKISIPFKISAPTALLLTFVPEVNVMLDATAV